MKNWLLITCIQFLIGSSLDAFSQHQSQAYLLTSVFDSTANSFTYIHPAKNHINVKLPKLESKYYSLSRSIKLPDFNTEIAVLIGRTTSNVDYIIIDANFNQDLSDDQVVYFPDTLKSPTKGNYKRFTTDLKIAGKTLPIQFDYSIIKPVQLNIDHGDPLENKIHFMVRPYQYRYTQLKVDTASYKLVLFSKNIFDFSKTSSYLLVVPDRIDIKTIKSTYKADNKYVKGDIILVGNSKFLFEKISPAGDSIYLESMNLKSDVYGSKVGFLAADFSGSDVMSNAPVLSQKLKGKYILLDFWGTWCAPCLKILPDLKKLHTTLDKQKITMIGVCYDKNIGIVENFLKKREIDWTQLFDSQTNSIYAIQFSVSSYPTFIVIDPSGKIVFKDEGLTGFQRLSEQIEMIITKN
ncbi:TlpA family protein disulfide reductase [Larkinella rosea]|uniref:TlpA family protein disulfide reductase n=1 Tax=Larkinella rosea TaxID=2025312 RepID=A0A3P1BK02_9BACT|nr:TlpA disulfide reductase family protein [Larkinella rosea]RRB01213.1 TlpA family protein disulfide reductase [Larkinella rosea]